MLRTLYRFLRREPTAAYTLIILAAGLAYLPLVGQLGFYNDDWFTLVSKVSGVDLVTMHSIDRPIMGQVYTFTYNLLGNSPMAWHLFAFAVRAMGGLVFLWLLRLVWPVQRQLTLTAAIFFVIYPGFLQQPGANNFSNHLVSLFLGLFSLALGVKALQCHSRALRILLVILSSSMVLVYPLIYEAMVGLEALRLIIYWVVLTGPQYRGIIRTARQVAANAWPQIFAVFLAVRWRLFVFVGGRSNTNESDLLRQYLADPLGMGLNVILETGRDWLETAVLAWTVPLGKLAARSAAADVFIPVGLAAVLLAGAWYYIHRFQHSDQHQNSAPVTEAVWVGILGVLVTLLPVILTGRSVDYSYSMDRFTLQSAAPAALLLAAFLFSVQKVWLRRSAVGVLLVIAVVTHFNNAVYYRDHWRNQQQVWFQMTERAPQIKPGTLLMVLLPPGYRQAEGFAVFGPANATYYPEPGPVQITAEVINSETVTWVMKGESLYRAWRYVVYMRDFSQVLVASLPSASSCLHIIDGSHPELSSLEDPMLNWVAPYSHIDQIITDGEIIDPPRVIFGPRPAVDWCTIYQRASLARQKGDWPALVSLAEQAEQMGFSPNDPAEWMPFIEGYARLGRVEDAQALVAKVKTDALLVHSICSVSSEGSLAAGLVCAP